MTGEKILNYRIENFTEENQLFRSFLATHTQFAKQVIVKTLKPLSSHLEKANFIDDLRKLASIQHPNVLTLYDHLETADDFYLVFEHVKGKNLADYIRYQSGPIPEDKAKTIFLKIAQAFEFAHQKGVMNGALNTSNILIDTEGNIKILDLALSKFFKQKMLAAEDQDTLRYASPEEINQEEPTEKSDVYALGLVLFEMLTGKNPYQGFSNEEIKQKITHTVLPRITKYYPLVSVQMQAIVDKATAKKPQERFTSVGEMMKAVEKLPPPQLILKPTHTKEEDEAIVKKHLQKTQKEEDLSQMQRVNLSLVLLGVLLLALTGLALMYATRPKSAQTDLLYNIKDMERIGRMQDSIAQVQAAQAIQDSIYRFSSINRKDSAEIYIHKVERGDNLAKIAKLYYQPLDSLKAINNLTGKERLKPREGIKVRVKTVYKIQKGEDLFQVGRKFNISPNVLRAVNRLYAKPVEPGEIPPPLVYEGKNIVIPLMSTQK